MKAAHRIEKELVIARIEALREVVDVDSDAIILASFGDPGDIPDSAPFHQDLRDLLRVANGMQCESIHIYGGSDVPGAGKFFASRLEDGIGRWDAIGAVIESPIFMDRDDGTIWHVWYADSADFIDEPLEKIAPDVWSFIGWFMMGPGYVEIFPKPGDWVGFLREHGLFEWEDLT